MRKVKEDKVKRMTDWLIAEDITFAVTSDNGQIHIYDCDTKQLIFILWATTEKMCDNPRDYKKRITWTGFHEITEIIKKYYVGGNIYE